MLQKTADSEAPVRNGAQGAESRRRILDAAAALMAERGYAGTSISAICQRSGLPASSVYWHFESKEGLLTAVMERGALEWVESIGSSRDLAGSPRERLRGILERCAARFPDRPAEFMRLHLMLALERSPHASVSRAGDRIRARMQEMLEDALFDVFREEAPKDEAARVAARESAAFISTHADGLFLEEEAEPGSHDPAAVCRQMEVAALAIGREVLNQHSGATAP